MPAAPGRRHCSLFTRYRFPTSYRSNDTGRVREVTNRRKPPCEIGCGHYPQGSLAKGSWHGAAVTEGFTAGTSPKHKPMCSGTHPIAPSGRELSPQVTEGASGRCSYGLLMGRYLLVVIDTRLEPFCLLSNRLSASACQRGLPFLLRQERKQRSRLKGG